MLDDARPEGPHSLDGHVRPRKRAPVVHVGVREPSDARGQRQDVGTWEARHRPAGSRVVAHRDRPAGKEKNDHPQSTLPPFTLRISPVMWRARSEQRNTIGPAMSSALPTRPNGIVSSISRLPSPVSRPYGCADISVSTHPGATPFTLF